MSITVLFLLEALSSLQVEDKTAPKAGDIMPALLGAMSYSFVQFEAATEKNKRVLTTLAKLLMVSFVGFCVGFYGGAYIAEKYAVGRALAVFGTAVCGWLLVGTLPAFIVKAVKKQLTAGGA